VLVSSTPGPLFTHQGKAQSKLHLLGSMLASLRQKQQLCQQHQLDLQQKVVVRTNYHVHWQ